MAKALYRHKDDPYAQVREYLRWAASHPDTPPNAAQLANFVTVLRDADTLRQGLQQLERTVMHFSRDKEAMRAVRDMAHVLLMSIGRSGTDRRTDEWIRDIRKNDQVIIAKKQASNLPVVVARKMR